MHVKKIFNQRDMLWGICFQDCRNKSLKEFSVSEDKTTLFHGIYVTERKSKTPVC